MTKAFTDHEVATACKAVVDRVGPRETYEHYAKGRRKRNLGLDYSYEACFVGQVVRELDESLWEALLKGEEGASDATFRNVDDFAYDVAVRFTVKQVEALTEGQRLQDRGSDWGTAAAETWKRLQGE